MALTGTAARIRKIRKNFRRSVSSFPRTRTPATHDSDRRDNETIAAAKAASSQHLQLQAARFIARASNLAALVQCRSIRWFIGQLPDAKVIGQRGSCSWKDVPHPPPCPWVTMSNTPRAIVQIHKKMEGDQTAVAVAQLVDLRKRDVEDVFAYHWW